MIHVHFNSTLANHLWQSTVFAGIAGLLAYALRHNYARTRHWIWLIASVKFLIPFSLLTALGGQFGWLTERFAGRVGAPEWPAVVQQIGQPFPESLLPAAVTAASLGPQHASILPELLLAIWACGFVVVLFSWWQRWRSIRLAVRAAAPLPLRLKTGLPVLSSPSALEPGVFGIVRPVLLLPEGITDHLAPAHLDAVLAHELCHVRRRDNLAAAAHMVVEAIFWFHPLVWWIGTRLVEERERACDEEVLRLGNQPEIYAESILKTCQFYLESPLACMSGIAGSDLKKRIVRIMKQGGAHQLGFGRKLLLATAGIAALTVPLVLGLMNAPQSRAQSPAPATAPRPAFDVASIKPSHAPGGPNSLFRVLAEPGKFTAEHVNVRFLLQYAYRLKDSQIFGAPAWLDSEHYSIEAKQDDASAELLRNRSRDEQAERLRLMIQSMLVDRFKLTLHHETKELPLYVLVVAKNGPKIQESADIPEDTTAPPGPPTPNGPQPRHSFRFDRGEFKAISQNMDRFADLLSHQVGRPVLNQTGLKGNYDFTLQWTPQDGERPMPGGPPGEAAPPADTSGPSIFTALQEQLGLRLEAQKGPVDTIVIDHVERPSEN